MRADVQDQGEQLAETQALIDRIVREALADADIDRIVVRPGVDYVGDSILTVIVILNDVDGGLDPAKTLPLIGQIRAQLSGEYEDSFPMIRYILKSEAATLDLATL